MQRSLFILFLAVSCITRANSLDSLLNLLKKDLPDTERINVLNYVCYETYLVDLNRAAPYAQQALTLAQQKNYLKGVVNAYLYLSYITHGTGENEKALGYTDSALAACDENKNERLKLKVLNEKGNIYGDLGDITTSLTYYIEASKIAEKYNDKKTLLVLYGNIGISFMSSRQYAKSKEYLKKGIALTGDMQDDKNKGSMINNLGGVYLDEHKYDSALTCFMEGEKLFEKAGYARGLGFTNYYMGSVYNGKKMYGEALKRFEKAAGVFSSTGHETELPNIYNCIADVLLKQKQPDKALEFVQRSLNISQKENSLPDMKEAYLVMKDVYQAKGDYKTALEYYGKYVKMRDSLFTSESTAQMAEMQTKYETEKKENENKLLQEKNENNAKVIRQQRYFGIAVGFICVLLVAFAIVIFRSNKQKHKANLALERKNHLIAKQKEIVEEKQKEILDSIHYARRIQRSLLTGEKYIKRQMDRLRRS